MYTITLICWSCGKKKEGVPVERLPRFAFEVAAAADSTDWVGFIDLLHNRTLVFCSRKCRMDQTTSKGLIRLRPKKIPKEAPSES